MGKLLKNQSDLKFIATHLTELGKSRNGRGVYFLFDTLANGNTAFAVLETVFPDNDKSYGIDKRDFNFLFPSREKRDEVYDQLSSEINDYKVKHDEEIRDKQGKDEDYDTGSDDTPDTATSGNKTYLYVVIGAAAIILILLLWDNKKR